MRKHLLFCVFIFLNTQSFAQDYQKEINDQVWKSFIQTFNNYDADGFLAIHSKDVIRSPRDSKTLLNWDEYLKEQKKWDQHAKERGAKRILELHFTERVANTSQAIDVGIYKTTNINSQGQNSSFYGRFHVVLRKEKGIWKILIDTDSSEGNTITEKDFLAAQPME